MNRGAVSVLIVAMGCSGTPTGPVSNCEDQADGTNCSVDDGCVLSAVCRRGACVVTASTTCEASSDPCQVAACDSDRGDCVLTPAPDATPCGSGDPSSCTPPSFCRAGVCAPERVDQPGDCVTLAPCEARTWAGNGWTVGPTEDGSACDDGQPCTRNTTCTAGVCGGGGPMRCQTENVCARAFCDPEVGCVEDIVADGSPCDDGEACTLESACSQGVCVATAEVECRVGPCVASSQCDPNTGRCVIEPQPDGMSCSDDNVCTAGDRCEDSVCVPTEAVPWEGEACSEGICFVDVTEASGVDFIGRPPSINAHGGPTALFDIDGDGDLDLLVGTETTPLRLYENDGSGRFTDITAAAGLSGVEQSSDQRLFAFAVGDIDNDGDPDLYIGMQDAEDYLFANDGSGRFSDVTATSGLVGTRPTNGADFGDFDEDGDLDLYVGHYIREPRFPFHVPEPNALYLNRGDGTFEEVTRQYRVGGGDIGGAGTSLVVRWTDYDQDGDLDLLECNDFGANVGRSRLYQNTGDPRPDRRFVDVSAAMNIDLGIYCMSITPGDYDRDGDLDFYFTNIGRHEFYRNDAPQPFAEVTDASQSGLQYDQCQIDTLAAGWSALLTDFDQDGWLDLFSANGYVVASDEFVNSEDVRNSVLRHQGPSLTFADISRTAGASSALLQSRGAAGGDIDGDGDQDVVVTNLIGPVEIFENRSPRAGGQVYVDAQGVISNRDGYHAYITAVFEDHVRAHEIDPHVGYQGVSEKAAHFGLGDASQIDEVRVRWPASGIEQSVFDVADGTRLSVVEATTTITGVSIEGMLVSGETGTVSLQLEHHQSEPAAVDVRVEDRSDRAPTAVGATRVTVPGAGSHLRSVDVTPGAVSGPRRYVVIIETDAGGVDEAELRVSVMP